MNSVNKSLFRDRRKVFILRIALANTGSTPQDEMVQWRGQLQNVHTGEKIFFQGVETLYEILHNQLNGDSANASPGANEINKGLR